MEFTTGMTADDAKVAFADSDHNVARFVKECLNSALVAHGTLEFIAATLDNNFYTDLTNGLCYESVFMPLGGTKRRLPREVTHRLEAQAFSASCDVIKDRIMLKYSISDILQLVATGPSVICWHVKRGRFPSGGRLSVTHVRLSASSEFVPT